jgi:hypothetical protein
MTASAPAASVTPICVRIPVAASMLGIGRTKLYELIGAGDVDVVKIGKSTLVLTESLHTLVARQRSRAS